MKTLPIIVVLACLAPVASGQEEIDFRNDLIPVFTRLGCNAGSCHGSAAGRGGLKLSLYGGDADSDYESVVRELGGRRINLARPDDSLIVLKPTENLEHGGGRLMAFDDAGSQLLLKWIRQGAKRTSPRELTNVQITPTTHFADAVNQPVQLSVLANYSDGSQRDVTRWTVFTAEDSSALRIDVPTATATVLRPGRHIAMARFMDQVIPLEFVVPLSDSGNATLEPRHDQHFIDASIDAKRLRLGLPASPVADDATFLRRITLDLTGRLPTPEFARSFLSDKLPEKRDLVIDRLLRSEPFTDYWTYRFSELFRVRLIQGDQQALRAYHDWLSKQIREDVGYDQIARQVVTAIGDTTTDGPANFHRSTAGPREEAELVSEVFMGTRLRCANCHNHPLDRWTQDDYHGLAAVFATVTRQPLVKRKPSGKVIHPRTREPALMRLPGGGAIAKRDEGLDTLADWLVAPDNPFFAKATVNRLWKAMMGRGLVDPVDDFRATNPATHPELLSRLADDFVSNGYSIRRTLKVIAQSDAYQRSSMIVDGNQDDPGFYSHAIIKPMPPAVLADAISDVLGISERYGDQPIGTRAITLTNSQERSRSLDVLGRCGRTDSCESDSFVGGLPQQLHLLNGELINRRLGTVGSRLNGLLKTDLTHREVMQTFAAAALGRRFNEPELSRFDQGIDMATTDQHAREALEDFVWALVTCDEFRSIR